MVVTQPVQSVEQPVHSVAHCLQNRTTVAGARRPAKRETFSTEKKRRNRADGRDLFVVLLANNKLANSASSRPRSRQHSQSGAGCRMGGTSRATDRTRVLRARLRGSCTRNELSSVQLEVVVGETTSRVARHNTTYVRCPVRPRVHASMQ